MNSPQPVPPPMPAREKPGILKKGVSFILRYGIATTLGGAFYGSSESSEKSGNEVKTDKIVKQENSRNIIAAERLGIAITAASKNVPTPDAFKDKGGDFSQLVGNATLAYVATAMGNRVLAQEGGEVAGDVKQAISRAVEAIKSDPMRFVRGLDDRGEMASLLGVPGDLRQKFIETLKKLNL